MESQFSVQEEIRKVGQEITALGAQITGCEGQIRKCEDQIGKYEDQIGKCEDQIGKCEDQIRELEGLTNLTQSQERTFQRQERTLERLCEEKKQLRDKEKQLREEKKHLCDKEKQLSAHADDKPSAKKPKIQSTDMLDIYEKNLGAISSFAKPRQSCKISHKLLEAGAPLYTHREDFISHHCSLFYEGFNKFSKRCETVTLTAEDTMFIMELCSEMANFYYGKFGEEEERRNAFMMLFQEYLSTDVIRVSYPDSILYKGEHKGTCDGLLWFHNFLLGIVEVKAEPGAGGCDSYMESVGYYPKLLKLQDYHKYCACPVFLLEVNGPNLTISGAVFGEAICVDRVVEVVWMVNQQTVPEQMKKMGRVFKALKEAIIELAQYYNEKPRLNQPRYPAFQTINNRPLEYTNTVKLHLFQGMYDDSEVFMKFPATYCIKAHQLLASENLAPKVFYHAVLENTNRHVIVMEGVKDAKNLETFLTQYPNSADEMKSQCTRALEILHSNELCHGDFRDNNNY